MSQTTPPGPRHARLDEPEPPTAAIPTTAPSEFTDDATQAIPVIPAQRTAPPARIEGPRAARANHGQPAGLFPVVAAPPTPPRRVLPAVLAAVTGCLLVAGVVVGVSGAAADLSDRPLPASATP